MNNIFKTASLCLCGAVVLTSCNDWLETTTESQTTLLETFASPAQTSLALNGIYGDLCGNNYTQLMTIHQGAGTDVELIDGIGSTATAASERGALNYNATSGGWNKLGTLWEEQYAAIEDCNKLIDGIDANKATISALSESERNKMTQYRSEAVTIRAMVYLDLIRVFGDIPMQMHAAQSDLSNTNVGKTGRDQILDSLIVQMETAVSDSGQLPTVGTVTTEHITQGYAEALLANIYMTRAGYAIREADNGVNSAYSVTALEAKGYETADYTDAIYKTMRPSAADRTKYYEKACQHLANVIKSGKYKMNDSFAALWENINKLTLDASYENMFEIAMGFGNSGELGYTVGVRLNGVTTDYGYGNSAGKLKTTAVQLYSYGQCDTRRDITCVPYEIKNYERKAADGGTQTVESMLGNKPFGLYIGKWDVRKMSDDWKSTNLTATAKFGYGINVVRMRYPQVLLWYAECLAALQDLGAGYDFKSEAFGAGLTGVEALKSVHARAYNDATTSYTGRTPEEELSAWNSYVDAISSTEDFMKKVREENKLEFCGESFRKWDLIRWNKLHDAIWTAKTNYKKWQDTRFPEKVWFKYKESDTQDVTKLEKQLDAASFTWYGKEVASYNDDGSMKTKGSEVDNSWLEAYGYRYQKGASDETKGRSSDGKGLNADSYSKDGFNKAYSNEDSELPSICGGLVGTQKNIKDATCTDEGVTVKNRYIMPIYDNTIQSSNGRLYNSYGY